MARRIVAEGTEDERMELVCDACGRAQVVDQELVPLERGADSDTVNDELPTGWRGDSKFDYCPAHADRVPQYEEQVITAEGAVGLEDLNGGGGGGAIMGKREDVLGAP